MATSASEWIEAFAARLGLDAPSESERSDLLALAGTAAHDSERTAAPIACWLAAKAGLTANEARAIAPLVAGPDEGDARDVD